MVIGNAKQSTTGFTRSINTKDFFLNILNSANRESNCSVKIEDMFYFFKSTNEGSLSADSDTPL